MSKVICNKSKTCTYSSECGGTQPHIRDGECNKCPRDKEARCTEYKED